VGIALQHQYSALLVLRCLQSTGSSSLIALANAIVADISPSSERGTYISYASIGSILGPSFGPVIGGLLSNYLGWRWIFWFLTIFAISIIIPLLLFFPETGRVIVGDGSIPPPALNHTINTYLYERRLKKEGRHDVFAERDRLASLRKTAWPNPMETVRIIFSKTAGLALLGNGVLFCCYYSIIGSIPSQFRRTYGYSDLHISLLYLPFGVGSLLSALTTGKFIDANFRRHAKKLGLPPIVKNRNTIDMLTFPLERARVEIAIPAILFGAVAMLIYGWLVDRRVMVAGPCVCLFAVGYAVSAGFNCLNLLLIDMYPGKPASATAANNLVRCWLGAGAAAAIVPLIDAVGYGPAVSISAGIWIAFTPALLALIKFGPRWRLEAAEKLKAKEEKKKQEDEEKEERLHRDSPSEEDVIDKKS
jgi:MFS family permease